MEPTQPPSKQASKQASKEASKPSQASKPVSVNMGISDLATLAFIRATCSRPGALSKDEFDMSGAIAKWARGSGENVMSVSALTFSRDGFSIELPDGTIENGALTWGDRHDADQGVVRRGSSRREQVLRFQFRSFPSNARASPHPGSSRSAMDGPSWLQWRTPKKQKTAPGPHGTPKTKEKKNRDTARRRHNRKAAKQHKAAAATAPGQQTLDQLAAKAQHVTMMKASCTMAFA